MFPDKQHNSKKMPAQEKFQEKQIIRRFFTYFASQSFFLLEAFPAS